jgi:hypothetical protein
VLGMALRWWGWPHWTDSDGGDTPHWSDVTASSWAGVEQTSVPFSRVPPSSFEGATPGPYESGSHIVTEADTGLTAQCRIVAGMALPGEMAEQRWGMIPKRVRGVARIRL